MADDNGLKIYFGHIQEAMIKLGRPAPTEESVKKHLQDAGLEDVVVTSFKQPLGPWAKNKALKNAGKMVRR